eukprot:SAG31_NODE_152_length_22216_cov_16.550029_6_plen_54_part_00
MADNSQSLCGWLTSASAEVVSTLGCATDRIASMATEAFAVEDGAITLQRTPDR